MFFVCWCLFVSPCFSPTIPTYSITLLACNPSNRPGAHLVRWPGMEMKTSRRLHPGNPHNGHLPISLGIPIKGKNIVFRCFSYLLGTIFLDKFLIKKIPFWWSQWTRTASTRLHQRAVRARVGLAGREFKDADAQALRTVCCPLNHVSFPTEIGYITRNHRGCCQQHDIGGFEYTYIYIIYIYLS